MDRTLPLRGRLAAGVAAGAGAAVLVIVYLFVLSWIGTAPGPGTFFTIAAAVLLGPAAYATPAAAAIGVVLTFVLAIGWAIGYVYLARSQPQLVARPLLSGAGFGLIVYTFSQVAMLGAGIRHQLTPGLMAEELLGHLVFYGIPVALIVASLAKPRPR